MKSLRTLIHGGTLASVMTIALNVVSSRALADAGGELSAQCNAFNTADFSSLQDAPTQITAAQWVEAKETLPAYCQVQGYVAPQIGFEIRLPASNWNRKFLMAGCGGFCGALWSSACEGPLRKGYACIVSDMGHKSGLGDALWAYHNLQAKMDYGYRATHVTALAGKAITERQYRKAPERSYFVGCSGGGRQGLVSAQRFPWDFDGIVAGAPTIDTGALAVYTLEATLAIERQSGDPVLPHSTLSLMHDTALAKCDLDDGVKDGIIGNPSACHLDPVELVCKSGRTIGCLTEIQAEAARKIYAGITTSTGEKIHPGAAVGSELNWNLMGQLKELFISAFRYMKSMPDPGPSWKLADFDADRDYKRSLMMEPLYSASNPDLRKLKVAGAKLIVYGGWNDVGIVPQSLIDYYETVERTMGGRKETQEFFRLFMIPGMNHCGGGDGADVIDFLSALESWVEHGQAPQRLLSAHVKAADYSNGHRPADLSKAGFTRPVYPYPQRARYKGSGDPNKAENFEPAGPENPVAQRRPRERN